MINKYFLLEYGTSCNLCATASHSCEALSSLTPRSLLQGFAKHQQRERARASSSTARKVTRDVFPKTKKKYKSKDNGIGGASVRKQKN